MQQVVFLLPYIYFLIIFYSAIHFPLYFKAQILVITYAVEIMPRKAGSVD